MLFRSYDRIVGEGNAIRIFFGPHHTVIMARTLIDALYV